MTRVAAVDIGTNSCRLLIAERDGDEALRTLDRRVRITRLGQDVDRTGRLATGAIDRNVSAVADYADAWRVAGVDAVRVTATSAARDAANAADFVAAIQEVADVAPEVLTGEEEAVTAFRGAVSGLPGVDRPILVLDIGGGSTELILGSDQPEASTSRQLGCVRLTERVLQADPPTPPQVSAARELVQAELDEVGALLDPSTAATLIGVAGTLTTLAALHLGLTSYEAGRVHGTRIPADAVDALATLLLASSAADIAQLGPVEDGREDVLAAGALILCEVMEDFGFSEVVVSETDILDGLALGLLDATS